MTEQAVLPEVEVEVGDSSDVELTPPEVYAPVLAALCCDAFDFDPCSHPQALVPAKTRIMPPGDGLSLPWPDRGAGWLNPPYSNSRPWLERASLWSALPGFRVVFALLKLDPTTRWWRSCVEPVSAVGVVLLRDRVRHIKPGRAKNEVAPFASALVAFGDTSLVSVLLKLRPLGDVVVWGINSIGAAPFLTEHQADAAAIAERLTREGELSGDNVRLVPSGRQCRACARLHAREARGR